MGDPVDGKDTTSGLVETESVFFCCCYCEACSLFAVSRGTRLLAVHGLLIAVASLVAEHSL